MTKTKLVSKQRFLRLNFKVRSYFGISVKLEFMIAARFLAFWGCRGLPVTLGWPPDCWGGQELSIEYSQASVAALGAKLALLLYLVKSCANGDKCQGNNFEGF